MSTILAGRGILLVEDQPLIAIDVADALESAGAVVLTASTLNHAMLAVERDGIAGAIIDHGLPDGNSDMLRKRLHERGIPFLIYSGSDDASGPRGHAPHIQKPADPSRLVSAMAELLHQKPPTK